MTDTATQEPTTGPAPNPVRDAIASRLRSIKDTPALPRSFQLYSHKISETRFGYFFDQLPAGTTQHDVTNGDYWRHQRDFLKRNDILQVIVDGDDGEPQRWEIELNVEAISPEVAVSLRQRFSRKPISRDVVQLGNGDYIQWSSDPMGRAKGFCVFKENGTVTHITGHQTVAAAQTLWAREQPVQR